MMYNVKMTSEAVSDMDQIYSYIAFTLLSPENAIAQYERIAKKILTLEYNPERIKVSEKPYLRRYSLRELFVDNYSVIFRISGENVYIINVLYAPSDIENRIAK